MKRLVLKAFPGDPDRLSVTVKVMMTIALGLLDRRLAARMRAAEQKTL